MSGRTEVDGSASSRVYKEPYSSRRPVPNIQDYEEAIQVRGKDAPHEQQGGGISDDKVGILETAMKRLVHPQQEADSSSITRRLYEGQNRNCKKSCSDQHGYSTPLASTGEEPSQHAVSLNGTKVVGGHPRSMAMNDSPQQRDEYGGIVQGGNQGRWVTDPVTHLPIYIHDSTSTELKSLPKGEELADSLRNNSEDDHRSQDVGKEQAAHHGMESLFPPPSYTTTGKQLAGIVKTALTAGLSFLLGIMLLLLLTSHLCSADSESLRFISLTSFSLSTIALLLGGVILGVLVLLGLRIWAEKKFLAVWENGIWDAARTRETEESSSSVPESVQWLNSLLTSVWPLVNPELFTSLADTVEDVMQASLPKPVRMISVDDLGQGNEAFRVLGIKWLPAGDAEKDVSASGQAQGSVQSRRSDRRDPETGSINTDADAHPHGKRRMSADPDPSSKGQALPEGMEAEEGNFFNVELCPDPPFVALCTFTLLGQPKVELSCVPLTRKGLNIMNLPLVSSFVQDSIDAALAEYVAPKSLTLDLKRMLVGDDFKKDVTAYGVLVVRIISAVGFKKGDHSLGRLREGSSDPYVAVCWAKFGKPVWSTRIIKNDMEPVWEETAFVLVGSNEVNAIERLRIQLWDSDRSSADDDLGRIEVDLKEVMSDQRSFTQMCRRCDGLRALSPDEEMPGKLTWSIGYFPKLRIQKEQLESQTLEPGIRTLQQMKDKIAKDVRKKMREALNRDESPGIRQQEAQDMETLEGI
ncbi:MAG: hypothetical protein Q9211_001766 [Gyalolechia sp. 1 TL-2023]